MVRHHHRRGFWLTAVAALFAVSANAQERPPLTKVPGDAARGVRLVIDIDKGNCVICHAIPGDLIPVDAAGTIGPPLAGVGARYNAGELRLRVVDPRASNPDTVMPSYYSTANLHRVQQRYAGLTILTAQEVEDVVAYLQTLQ